METDKRRRGHRNGEREESEDVQDAPRNRKK